VEIGRQIERLIGALDMKKVEFAKRLEIDQSYVTKLISSGNTPSDRLIRSICREFNVNEEWLRTGEGEMFRIDPEYDETAVYASELLLEKDNPFYDLIIEIMHTYYDLDPKSQEVIKNSIVKLVENLKKREG